jgi:hypothetical protein
MIALNSTTIVPQIQKVITKLASLLANSASAIIETNKTKINQILSKRNQKYYPNKPKIPKS